MTDKLTAVGCLASFDDAAKGACSEREQALSKFYDDANGDFLVINKWFGIQVTALATCLMNTCPNKQLTRKLTTSLSPC